MNSRIEERARELGFDACAITTASPPETAEPFKRWIAARYHGEMQYLERSAHKRIDPHQVLADAKSIVTLAVSYHQVRFQDESASKEPSRTESPRAKLMLGGPRDSGFKSDAEIGKPAGVIARYARFDDYHDVLADRLKQLSDQINALGGEGTRSLWYVDTGPFLERDLAQRAGLGFVGKHTNLISRQLGNWFFLAEIITTLELTPGTPEKNRCGSCTRCLTACPTGAIAAPFQLDARRCISYLTIELKGSIPRELRPLLGNRIYGCDDCLAACPWNRFAREGHVMSSRYRSDMEAPDLIELLSLDEAAFKLRFKGTPMLRTKRRGLLRNVCVALGNVGDESALPALERACQDSEPLVAEHAEWAMEQIRSSAF